MTDVSTFFDRSGVLKRPPIGKFLQEFGALLTDRRGPPTATLPDGKGQVVLVLPGFMTNDGLTKSLRDFLDGNGFRTFGWDHGVNLGPTPAALQHLRRRLDALYELNSGPVALVGVSLGGVLVRDLAYDRPHQVRHVVTLASPFRLPTVSPFEPLVRLCGWLYDPSLDVQRLSTPLPVPATAFYTLDDAVVAWQTCLADDPDCLNIEVGGPHMTICRNPAVLTQLVHRLAANGG
jgi:pimeloyl-ACP methyl ester carboxylesterase